MPDKYKVGDRLTVQYESDEDAESYWIENLAEVEVVRLDGDGEPKVRDVEVDIEDFIPDEFLFPSTKSIPIFGQDFADEVFPAPSNNFVFRVRPTGSEGEWVSIPNVAVKSGFSFTEDEPDMVNHPPHYTSDPSGVECITVTRHRNFNVGNAIKYLWRAGLKGDAGKNIEDLRKAVFYVNDEIARLELERE